MCINKNEFPSILLSPRVITQSSNVRLLYKICPLLIFFLSAICRITGNTGICRLDQRHKLSSILSVAQFHTSNDDT